MNQSPQSMSRKSSSAAVALWCCAGLLGMNLVLGGGMGRGPADAGAEIMQSGTQGNEPPFNAADQRKRMIEQLTQLNDRMGRIEAKLDKGISVKVTEMPAAKKE